MAKAPKRETPAEAKAALQVSAAPGGRRLTLTKEHIDVAKHLAGLGFLRKDIWRLLMVSESTFHRWLARGRAEADRMEASAAKGRSVKPRAAERLYLEFWEAVEGGTGEYLRSLLVSIKRGTLKDPKMALELLKMVRPEADGRAGSAPNVGVAVAVTTDGGSAGAVAEPSDSVLTDDDYGAAAEALVLTRLKRVRAARSDAEAARRASAPPPPTPTDEPSTPEG